MSTHRLDLVAERSATRETDEATLQKIAAVGREGGQPTRFEGDGFTAEFSAPSTRPPPSYRYHMKLTRQDALDTAEPYGSTRFDL